MAAAHRKLTNDYARAVPAKLYEDLSKAAWAALAVSALTNGGDWLDRAEACVLEEWWILWENGIIPQKPTRPRPDPEVIDETH